MIYLVQMLIDYQDWDQYDAFVVKANSKEEALKFCEDKTIKEKGWQDSIFHKENTTTREITENELDGIILGSYVTG